MQPQPTEPSFPGMEDTLRDACERAMQIVFPLPTMLRLYRSVIGLTRALMQARVDAGLPAALGPELTALLEQVRDTVGLHFPDPDMPVQDAIRLHTAMIALARIAHRARIGRLNGRLPHAPTQADARPPVEHAFEIAPSADSDTDLDTPRPVDFRCKVLNGDPVRDLMSRRYGLNHDIERDYQDALRQPPTHAGGGSR